MQNRSLQLPLNAHRDVYPAMRIRGRYHLSIMFRGFSTEQYGLLRFNNPINCYINTNGIYYPQIYVM